MLLLKSNIPTLKDSYQLLDTFTKYEQDVINKFVYNKNKISNIYGFINRDEINIIIFIIKMLNDYNVLYKPDKSSLSNIKDLICKTCKSINRCTDTKTATTYIQILCKNKLIDT